MLKNVFTQKSLKTHYLNDVIRPKFLLQFCVLAQFALKAAQIHVRFHTGFLFYLQVIIWIKILARIKSL